MTSHGDELCGLAVAATAAASGDASGRCHQAVSTPAPESSVVVLVVDDEGELIKTRERSRGRR